MGANRELAINRFRKHANGYDATTHRGEPVRKQVMGALGAHRGNTELDVASGTGLARPWTPLKDYVANLRIRSALSGTRYVAIGTCVGHTL